MYKDLPCVSTELHVNCTFNMKLETLRCSLFCREGARYSLPATTIEIKKVNRFIGMCVLDTVT